MTVDRGGLLRNVFGDMAKVPPGPMSQIFSIWDPETRELPHDSARAARTLTRLGWSDSDGDGIRDRDGPPLAFRLLVPTTSAPRRQYARLLQEQASVLPAWGAGRDRKSTRLNSSHRCISYAVFCLKKKKKQ